MKNNLVVVAIGGNSLVKDESHKTIQDQYNALVETSKNIADIIEQGLNVVITHGNGPQVGFILRRSEIAYAQEGMHTVPISSCVADTQGAIGFQLKLALSNELKKRGIEKESVAIVTLTVVDKNDEAFKTPAKPIGSFYTERQKENFKENHPDWIFIEDAGRGYRRVVPSPNPVKILELDIIKDMIDKNNVVIAAGGGGIPVVKEKDNYKPVEAVIDKDLASSMLAGSLSASRLIISTSVSHVFLNYKTEDEKRIEKTNLEEIKRYRNEGHFKTGSMLPKIEAAIDFLEAGGEQVIIVSPEYLGLAVKGECGTIISR